MPTLSGSDTLNLAFPAVLVNGAPIGSDGGGPTHSAEIVGTGTPQAFAHGLGIEPAFAIALPTQIPGGSAVASTVLKDATNVTVTMTLGVTYIILVWAV